MGTSQAAAMESPKGPLPLVISVTGHRDLRQEDRDALATRLREIIVDLQNSYPHTPLVLLSPLAEGADRLAAQVALACGVRLIAPLPMPREAYETDFQSSESVKEFRELLHQATLWFDLPTLPSSSAGQEPSLKEARDRQYAYVGAFIARHCQILIALWDGVKSEAEGGTAQIVHFKLQGVPERYTLADEVSSPLDPVDSGPVYHIVTPRVSNISPAGPAFRLLKLFPPIYEREALAQAAYHRIYAHMNTFNRDVLRSVETLDRVREQSKAYVIPPSQAARFPYPLRRLLERYATADALALAFQRRTLLTLRGILVLSVVATIFFQLYGQVESKPWELALGYVGALAVAYAWYVWAKRHDYDNKYLDYRALAEGLRVQLFWRLAGLRHAVADHYLRKQRGELDWIRQALRVWDLIEWEGYAHPDPQPALKLEDKLRLILKHWVEDQFAYFSKVALREQAKFQRLKKVSYAFFLAGLAMGMIKMFLSPDHPLLVAIGIAVILAALLLGYAKSRALSEHAKQYGRMSLIFANAKRHLDEFVASERPAAAQTLLEELGKEALAENGDWVLLHRERPIQVPKS